LGKSNIRKLLKRVSLAYIYRTLQLVYMYIYIHMSKRLRPGSQVTNHFLHETI